MEYGWLPHEVEALTPTQVRYYADHLPLVAARREYPLKHLMATVLNLMGGKPDPVKAKGDVIPPERLYNPLELLSWYASFGETVQTSSMSTATAQDIMGNLADVPAWALHLVPLEEAKRVLAEG